MKRISPLFVWVIACHSGALDPSAPADATASGVSITVPPYHQEQGYPGSLSADFAVAPSAFYATPWPSELWRTAEGRPDFSKFPHATRALVRTYVAQAASDLDGFSPMTPAYFHFTGQPSGQPNAFDGALDASALPSPDGTRTVSSPVFLLDVDPKSPERGVFLPLEFRTYDDDGTYVPKNTLAAKPLTGVVLRPSTLYAFVVRRDFAAGGELLGTTSDLEETKSTTALADPVMEAARRLHAPTYDYLYALGIAREDIAAIALFRTGHPQAGSERLVADNAAPTADIAPRLLSAEWDAAHDGQAYVTLRGLYCTPNYQTNVDAAPYTTAAGGSIAFAADGTPLPSPIPPSSRYYAPECQGLMRARFVLSVPKTAMPDAGFALLVSAHGTGGSAETFLGDDDFAGWAAARGIAVVSTDQPLHAVSKDDPGRRPGSDVPLALSVDGLDIPVPSFLNITTQDLFYNFLNPAAGRDNIRQATTDTVVLARLIGGTDFAALLPEVAGRTRPRFDLTRVVLAGHSEGSQTIMGQGALDPLIRAVLLSGCGTDVREGILLRSDPFPIHYFIGPVLGAKAGELDVFHPIMMLAQALADAGDPGNYARYYFEPSAARRDAGPGAQRSGAQNVIHYVGTNDVDNPPASGNGLAAALHATARAPELMPVQALDLLGIGAQSGVIANNLAGATIGFLQLTAPNKDEGHFVLYEVPGASDIGLDFLRSAVDGAAQISGAR